jgi:hypothetical protein
MTLAISLYLDQPAFAPGEGVRPVVILSNLGSTSRKAPALDGTGHRAIQFTLLKPGGDLRSFALPDDTGAAPHRDGTLMDLDAGYEFARAFLLLDTDLPGFWELKASLELAGEATFSNNLRWYQESPRPIAVVTPVYRGAHTPAGHRSYYLFRGERLSGLYVCNLRFDDNRAETLVAGDPQHLTVVDGEVRELCAVTGAPSTPNFSREWLAWLSNGDLHAAVEVLGLQRVICPLPFEAGGIAGLVPGTEGDGCEVLVLEERRRSLALIRFGQPEPQALPTLEDSGGVESDLADDEVSSGEPEDDDEPFFPVEVPEPRVVWTYSPERAIAGAAFAAGVGEYASHRALVLTMQQENGVEVLYAGLDEDETPSHFASIVIADGRLLEGCAPAMAIDRKGCAQIALLLLSNTPDGQIQVIVARTSFTRDGRPRLDSGTVYHEAAVAPAQPLGGTVSLYVDDQGGPWYIDWCVLLPENRCLVSSRGSTAQLKTPEVTIAQPLALLGFAERCYLTAFAAGQPKFIDCA